MKKPTYKMRAKVWLYPGNAAWHFVNIGKKESKEIKDNFGGSGRGFGSVPVTVIVGKTHWKTSIFPDSKRGCYVLPIKKEIRKKEGIKAGEKLSFSIEINI